MHTLESDRERKFGELSEQLSLQHEGVTSLLQTTQSLREALSSTKARGRWGERMAEDVLQLAGFVENVNYRKQKAIDGGRGIPDYTFLLPNDLLLHMDVKFPLDNYVRFCEATSDLDRKRHRDDFLKDVRARVRELSGRDYPDAAGGTVDFVLLFIPNEQLYAFIHEQDGSILDDAVRQRVVFCSPLTLFVVLALIRQMVENFRLARTSDEILALLGQFSDQWSKFKDQMAKVGARIEAAGKEYEALVGTRKRALEKPLLKIDDLRGRQLELIDDEEDPGLALEA
jgi:DNA recombination protein RmuC